MCVFLFLFFCFFVFCFCFVLFFVFCFLFVADTIVYDHRYADRPRRSLPPYVGYAVVVQFWLELRAASPSCVAPPFAHVEGRGIPERPAGSEKDGLAAARHFRFATDNIWHD